MSKLPTPPAALRTSTTFDISQTTETPRPPVTKHLSAPGLEQTTTRHHSRKPSAPRPVKETLNARSEYTSSQDDGAAEHHINQYIVKQEIGRGSFGAVHFAVDQFGEEYAVKEFSKSRLRKRAQSSILRRPGLRQRAGAAGGAFNSPLHRQSPEDVKESENNPLLLIKEEIAIMKKLNHPNLVALIEVLDDPTEDSLYMVMEMCKKGVIMKVGLGEVSDPYDSESCRSWFRDLILGIEYLHAQGVVHRDIKPDNCLLTEDDVLKVVDFGVSEMFAKDAEMLTAKSAGSPAFLPPELCIVGHGDVSGKAADIWSMGVTLYCLRYGRIPFEQTSLFELFEAIKTETPQCPGEEDEDFKDLMSRILEKDPTKRIKMPELREHPWVTKGGTDPLMSTEENVDTLVEAPTEEEFNMAISNNMTRMIVVMKAVHKFKKLLDRRRPFIRQSFLGSDSKLVQPPRSYSPQPGSSRLAAFKSYSEEYIERPVRDRLLASEGVTRALDSRLAKKIPGLSRLSSSKSENINDPTASAPALGGSLEVPDHDAALLPEPTPISQINSPLPSPRPAAISEESLPPKSPGLNPPKSPRTPVSPQSSFQIPRRPVASPTPSLGLVSTMNTDISSPPLSPQPPSFAIPRRPVPVRSPVPSETAPVPIPTPLKVATQSDISIGTSDSHQEGKRGHAHDPLSDQLFLYIGPSTWAGPSTSGNNNDEDTDRFMDLDGPPIISESPGAADMSIYETAYLEEIERIRAQSREQKPPSEPDLYLNRRVDGGRLARIAEVGRLIKEHGRNRLPIFHDNTGDEEDERIHRWNYHRRSPSNSPSPYYHHRFGRRDRDESPGFREGLRESFSFVKDEAKQAGRERMRNLRDKVREKRVELQEQRENRRSETTTSVSTNSTTAS